MKAHGARTGQSDAPGTSHATRNLILTFQINHAL